MENRVYPFKKKSTNHPIWNILVKLDHFPKFRGENKQILETTNQKWVFFIFESNQPVFFSVFVAKTDLFSPSITFQCRGDPGAHMGPTYKKVAG